MATQPILGGVTLTYVSEYEEERFLKGASAEMADGSIVVDVLGSGAAYRKRFKLGWKAIGSANAGDIFSKKDVDGGLVGGASLLASEFSVIIKSLKK